jgi:signal peptidase I
MSSTTGQSSEAGRVRSWRRVARDWVVVIVVAVLVSLAVKTWVLEAYVIPSGSMEPTIHLYDRVLVDKLAFDFGSVHRGDIIVFAKPPADTQGGDIDDLIKRVIGLPGETLRSGPDGEIFVDGKRIVQPWVTAAALDAPQPTICDRQPGLSRVDCIGDTLHLPKNEYYVMGDNRSDSEDSRYWGPLAAHLIVGKAFVRIWPLSRLHWF